MAVATTLAYVRQQDGTVAQLDPGDSVPEGSDVVHVKQLTEHGVLADAPESKQRGSRGNGGQDT